MSNDRVDELRKQLRSLGYLDAGVDRFLLAPASGTGGPMALAARASARVGLLGGALLGPAAAIGIGARLPGLLSGVRDALVVALYLAVFFFIAITVSSFLVTLVSTLLARGSSAGFAARAARMSRLAGWIASLACLAYLTLWWRNANAGFGWSAPVWTAFALVVAVVISLLLGHAQRITTLAVLAAATGPEAALPPVAGRSWHVIAAAGALAFAGAAALLVATASMDAAGAEAHPSLTVVSRGITVKVLAVDGVDPTLVDERTWIPAPVEGRRFLVDYQDTADAARTWTTIATGAPPEVHGIHAIEARRVPGIGGILSPETSATGRLLRQATDVIRLTQPSLATRNERKVMSFWEVAEAAGLRTAVLNWWATWPAVSQNGIIVSDRAVLRLEHGGALDAEISPPAAYADLLKRWPGIWTHAQELAKRRFAGMPDRDVAAILVRSAVLDATVLGLDAVLADPGRDLDVVYLPGLDIAQHALLGAQAVAGLPPSALAARLSAIRSYHGFLGDLVGPWLGPPSPQFTGIQVAMIITAPGRLGSNAKGHVTTFQIGPPPPLRGSASTAGVHTRDSVPAITDVTDRIALAADIAPTILNLLGVPISRELTGAALPVGYPTPDRFVTTYGRPSAAPPQRTGRALDQEAIDRLRSLGYIK